jgi:SnoaL-like domain
MIAGLAYYTAPLMITDEATRESLNTFIARGLDKLSTPGSDVADTFSDPNIAIAGSGLDEYFMGPDEARSGMTWVSTLNLRWQPRVVVSWMCGDIAWAQIRMDVHKTKDAGTEIVEYVMTGVFGRDGDGWSWLYWGGGEPQKEPKV